MIDDGSEIEELRTAREELRVANSRIIVPHLSLGNILIVVTMISGATLFTLTTGQKIQHALDAIESVQTQVATLNQHYETLANEYRNYFYIRRPLPNGPLP